MPAQWNILCPGSPVIGAQNGWCRTLVQDLKPNSHLSFVQRNHNDSGEKLGLLPKFRFTILIFNSFYSFAQPTSLSLLGPYIPPYCVRMAPFVSSHSLLFSLLHTIRFSLLLSLSFISLPKTLFSLPALFLCHHHLHIFCS